MMEEVGTASSGASAKQLGGSEPAAAAGAAALAEISRPAAHRRCAERQWRRRVGGLRVVGDGGRRFGEMEPAMESSGAARWSLGLAAMGWRMGTEGRGSGRAFVRPFGFGPERTKV